MKKTGKQSAVKETLFARTKRVKEEEMAAKQAILQQEQKA